MIEIITWNYFTTAEIFQNEHLKAELLMVKELYGFMLDKASNNHHLKIKNKKDYNL